MNALQEAMSAARRTPTDKEAWLALGAILVAEGQPERARDCFERALLLDPTDEEAERALRALGGESDDNAADPLDGLMAGVAEPDPLEEVSDFDNFPDFPDFDDFDDLDDFDEDDLDDLDDLDFVPTEEAPDPFSLLDEGGAPRDEGAEPFRESARRPRLQGAARLWAGLGLVGLGAFLCLCGLIVLIALLFWR